MSLATLTVPAVHFPGTVSHTLFTASSTPAPTGVFAVVAGAGTGGVTFSNLQYLAYNAGLLAAADRGGTIYVFTSSTGVLLHSWSIGFGGANIGGIAVDPGGLIYVIETQQASNSFTGKIHQYTQAGVESTGNWPYALSFITDAGWGWQSSTSWYVVVPNRTGTTAQLVTTTGTSGGTNGMTHDYMGAQAPGALLTTSTYEATPQYVRTWHGDGTAGLYFGSGARFSDATLGRCFSLLSGALTMTDGTCYVLDSDNNTFLRFDGTGFQTGSTTLASGGSGHSMTQYCPIASDGTTIWFASSDSGGLLLSVTRANLDTLLTYPRTNNYLDQSMGVGAGLISSATNNYYASGAAPAISLYLDTWWSQVAGLSAQYCVRSAAALHSQDPQSWTTISSPTIGGSTALTVKAGTGYYEVECQLLVGGVARSAGFLYYAVGPAGATLNFATLATAGTPQRQVQLADELLGGAGMVRIQLDWSVLLPSGPAGGANSLVTSAYDTLIANASTEAATRGVQLTLQIFQGNGDTGETALFAYGSWTTYITALVNHYKSQVHAWDIWNEPNNSYGQGGGMATFTTSYLIPTANAIHAADATALVVGPSFLKLDMANQAIVNSNGGYGVVDVVSVHPYGEFDDTFEEQGQPAALDTWLAALGTYGAGSKPRWFTEWGASIDALVPNLLLEAQAYASVLLWMRVKGIAHLYPYVYEGTGGLGSNQGLLTAPFLQGNAPSMITMAAAVCLGAKAAYGSRTYHDQPATNAPFTYAARFVDSDQLIAVWTAGVSASAGSNGIPMALTSSAACTLTIWDAFGTTRQVALVAGRSFLFGAVAWPVYLQAPLTTTLTLAGAESWGTNLASTGTASASSTGAGNGGTAALIDGVADAQGADGFPLTHAWYQAVSDSAPWALVTLASPATVDRVLVVSHSNGSTIPSLRNYTVSTQVAGVWTVQATIADQYVGRAGAVVFPAVSNCQAVRVDVQAINWGGFAGGVQPSFWKVSGNPAANTAYNDPAQQFYGPAPILEIQVYGAGTPSVNGTTWAASSAYPATGTYPATSTYPSSAIYPS